VQCEHHGCDFLLKFNDETVDLKGVKIIKMHQVKLLIKNLNLMAYAPKIPE